MMPKFALCISDIILYCYQQCSQHYCKGGGGEGGVSDSISAGILMVLGDSVGPGHWGAVARCPPPFTMLVKKKMQMCIFLYSDYSNQVRGGTSLAFTPVK